MLQRPETKRCNTAKCRAFTQIAKRETRMHPISTMGDRCLRGAMLKICYHTHIDTHTETHTHRDTHRRRETRTHTQRHTHRDTHTQRHTHSVQQRIQDHSVRPAHSAATGQSSGNKATPQ